MKKNVGIVFFASSFDEISIRASFDQGLLLYSQRSVQIQIFFSVEIFFNGRTEVS